MPTPTRRFMDAAEKIIVERNARLLIHQESASVASFPAIPEPLR